MSDPLNEAQTAAPKGRSSSGARGANFLDRILDRTARADARIVNIVLIALIVFGSVLMSVAIFWLVAPAVGLVPSPALAGLIAGISINVSLLVGIPGVLFAAALVRRVHKITAQLQTALVESTLASRAKSEFLANISHEIRTPMNGVLGMAQVLESTPLSDEQREHLRLIRDSGDMLMALIDDLLDLARIEAGKLDLHKAPRPLPETLSDIVALFKARAEENGTTLAFLHAPDTPQFAVFDQLRVRQCMGNLVSNAVKFTRNGAVTVDLTTHPLTDAELEVQVRITDTGIGIQADALSRLFAPFAQADAKTVQDFGGTGLGLAISRRLARKMGGDITVTSTFGEGSCFNFRFRADRVAADYTPPLDDRAELSDTALQGRLVLVVDDSNANRRVVSAMLATMGIECHTAESGAAALSMLTTQTYDAMLLDIQMPVMDGPATLQAIRTSQQEWADIPVIALTANAMPEERERYMAMGMQGYAAKPIRQPVLREEIFKALGILN